MNTKKFEWDFDQHDPDATWTKLVSAALTMWFLTVFQLYFSTLFSQLYFLTVFLNPIFYCISHLYF